MSKKESIKHRFMRVLKFFANPRLLLCVGLAWLITNGWAYILFAVGGLCKIGWMVALSSAYLTFLWLPISPEKIVTAAISILLLKLLFPRDTKTLGVLRDLFYKAKQIFSKKRKGASKKQTELEK